MSPLQEQQRWHLSTVYRGMRSAQSSGSRWEKTFYFHLTHIWIGNGCSATEDGVYGILNGELAAHCSGSMNYIQPRLAYTWLKNWAWNLRVSISGSTGITQAGTYTWTAYPSGGNGIYTYKWEYSSNAGSTWSQVGTSKS